MVGCVAVLGFYVGVGVWICESEYMQMNVSGDIVVDVGTTDVGGCNGRAGCELFVVLRRSNI